MILRTMMKHRKGAEYNTRVTVEEGSLNSHFLLDTYIYSTAYGFIRDYI